MLPRRSQAQGPLSKPRNGFRGGFRTMNLMRFGQTWNAFKTLLMGQVSDESRMLKLATTKSPGEGLDVLKEAGARF